MTATQRVLATVIAALVALSALHSATTRADLDRDLSLIKQLGERESAEPAKLTDAAKAQAKLDEALAGAATIDQYLEAKWKENHVRPNDMASDEVFLRRIYLEIAGRIPTLEETLEFSRSGDSRKRQKLIDKLLDSEAYVSNMFNFWADVLRVQSEMQGDGNQYAAWIKTQLRENVTYDKFVYALITSEGYTWEDGAAGYYLRDDGMPLDNMANTVQVFLGTSLVCAQCHDHPFDKWTQYEFYEMAAYTYGIKTRVQPDNLRQARQMVAGDEAARTALDNLTREITYGVSYTGPDALKLPHDYKYDDAKPLAVVKPYTIFGNKAEASDPGHLREAYAAWITSPDNPRFTHVIANRLWKKAFGVGLIEPVDMWTDDSKAYDAQLLDYMAHKMRSFNYDTKQFLRMIYNTRTFQREVSENDVPESGDWHFTGPILHRMTAEQFWDSLMTLTIPSVDERGGSASYGMYGYGRGAMLQKMTASELAEAAKKFAVYDTKRREFNDKIADAREKKNDAEVKRLTAERNKLVEPSLGSMMKMESGDNKMSMDDSKWKGFDGGLKRASELRSPENVTHFLRQFGQSDREVISNANQEANIVQVLSSFNGGTFRQVMADSSVLSQNLGKVGSDSDKVSVIFLSLLNRKPTSGEMSLTMSKLRGRNGQPDWDKVVWALLNTREFSFVQ